MPKKRGLNLTIRMNDKVYNNIEKLEKVFETPSMASTVKRAVAVMSKIGEYAKNGKITLLVDNDDSTKQVDFHLNI